MSSTRISMWALLRGSKCQNRYICFSRCVLLQIFVFFAILFAYQASAFAQTWERLTEDQKLILAPLESDWSGLTKDRQKKWLEVANRYPRMSEQDKQTLQSRMTSWAHLSTQERQKARDNYLRTLNISPEKKAEAWQAYQQLSEEDKKKLAERRQVKPSTVTSPTLK